MAASTTKSKSDKQNSSIKVEDELLAVVIADSFDERFTPLTITKPRVLLPVANCPIIDYTLEFLHLAGIKDVLLFCSSHSAQIKSYVESCDSLWRTSRSMRIAIEVSDSCASIGDALRELDAKGRIKSDFVLLFGDTVANLNLLKTVEDHKEWRKRDKGAVMTCVFRRGSPGHKSRCSDDNSALAVRRESSRILHYQKTQTVSKINFPLNIFQENDEIDLHYDLMDCHLCICSPQVPLLYTENFDYQTVENFVRGILINEEILGNTIRLHLEEDKYACRINNLHMYATVSRDILRRWTYPNVLELMSNTSATRYLQQRHNIYKGSGCSIDRGTILGQDVMIGPDTKIGKNCNITNTVIGSNCTVGNNVILTGVHLWDNSRVADDCRLADCIVAGGARIANNVTVTKGCLISFNVVIGPSVCLPEGTLVDSEPQKDEFTEQTAQSVDKVLLGAESNGYVFRPADEADEDSDSEPEDGAGQRRRSRQIWVERGDEESSEGEGDVDSDWQDGKSDVSSLVHSDRLSPVLDDTRVFYSEVLDSLHRGWDEKVKGDHLVLEINSSKYAYNVTMKELNQLVTRAVLELAAKARTQEALNTAEYLKRTRQIMQQFLPVFQNYIKSAESQLNCLTSIEEFGFSDGEFLPIMVKVVHYLYESDILSEECVLSWYNKQFLEDLAAHKAIRKTMAPFVQWLQEAEEDSD